MPMKLLSTDDFRAAAKDGRRPEGTVFRFATSEPEVQGEDDARTIRFVFSDATVDHSNDSIDPKGWDTAIFKRNPVALFSHMSWEPPIGRASNVGVTGAQLLGDIEFASAEVYPFADTIYRLVKGRFMNAVSVGFLPKEWAFSSDKDRPYGIDFKKQVLLEISVCPVPCNPNALGEARGMGVDTWPLVEWAEKVLDNGDRVMLPRQELEALRLQAKGAAPTRYYIQADAGLTPDQAKRVREDVKRWQDDPSQVLILAPGFTLRTVGEAVAEPVIASEDANAVRVDDPAVAGGEPQAKAGRRISAATRAKLQEALDHHQAAMDRHAEAAKCVTAAMGDDEEPGADADPEDDLTPEPEATVIPEDMTPEQRRLKEARDLRASLPAID